jgi:hypothetical protein
LAIKNTPSKNKKKKKVVKRRDLDMETRIRDKINKEGKK